jgi:NhaP-type Na+/H+ or K+/H+ antiporter
MWWGWVVVAAVAVAYSALSQRLNRGYITAPMVFVALGALVAQDGLGLVEVDLGGDLTKALFKVTLAILLFVEAATIDIPGLRRDSGLVARLLGIAMPLLIMAGTAAALLLFGVLTFWEAAVVSAILAPTDAAVGSAVVSNPRVPARIRGSLIVESGLNDGLALPLALLFTAAALAQLGIETRGDALTFLLQQVGFGVIAGIAAGAVAGWLIRRAYRNQWAGNEWTKLSTLAVALLAYASAEAVHGNGFIAAWVAGFVFGNLVNTEAPHIEEFGERFGKVLTVVSFFVFGATMLAPGLSLVTWQMVIFGVLSLALLRPLAVALGMIGAKLPWQSVAFLGWFGPRGIASIIIVAIIIKEAGLPGDDIIVTITTVVVAMSVYLHGLTAVPGAERYADWQERQPTSTLES